MNAQELHRYKTALEFAYQAEIEVLRLRAELLVAETKLAEMTELAGDAIVAIATLDMRPLVVVLA